MELVDGIEFLARTYKLDRFVHYRTDREGRTTAGITVELGQHYAVKVEAFVELFGCVDRILSGHRVYHEQNFVGLDGFFDGSDLIHHLFVDFNDFLSQISQIKKMGNLKELASMIPGVGKAIKDIDIDDNAFKSIEAIIYSMTPEERSNPGILNGSRRTRIAKGSGTTIQEVNRLLKQFDQTRKMMKMVTSSKMGKMMPKMK